MRLTQGGSIPWDTLRFQIAREVSTAVSTFQISAHPCGSRALQRFKPRGPCGSPGAGWRPCPLLDPPFRLHARPGKAVFCTGTAFRCALRLLLGRSPWTCATCCVCCLYHRRSHLQFLVGKAMRLLDRISPSPRSSPLLRLVPGRSWHHLKQLQLPQLLLQLQLRLMLHRKLLYG